MVDIFFGGLYINKHSQKCFIIDRKDLLRLNLKGVVSSGLFHNKRDSPKLSLHFKIKMLFFLY
jgi:hypothetical protein